MAPSSISSPPNPLQNSCILSLLLPPPLPPQTLRNRIICGGSGGGSNSDKMHEFCKGLGGELIEEGAKDYILY